MAHRPTEGDPVEIFGSTGVVTKGNVADASAELKVVENTGNDVDVARFSDHIMLRSTNANFVRPGDSGSLVVVREGATVKPVGLVVARSVDSTGVFAVVSPLGHAFQALAREGITPIRNILI
jgi:hypothetical protein